MFQLSKFKDWISQYHPNDLSEIDEWSKSIQPCEPNEVTGKDIHLVQSIKDSITDRFIEMGTG